MLQTSQIDSPPAVADVLAEELSEVLPRFGRPMLRRLPRPRFAAAGDLGAVAAVAVLAIAACGVGLMVGAETEPPREDCGLTAGVGVGDNTTAGVEADAFNVSVFSSGLGAAGTAGEFNGVLVAKDSLLVDGLGGSMLSFGT